MGAVTRQASGSVVIACFGGSSPFVQENKQNTLSEIKKKVVNNRKGIRPVFAIHSEDTLVNGVDSKIDMKTASETTTDTRY